MCTTVIVGTVEVDTPVELARALGVSVDELIVDAAWSDLVPTACLCQVDVEATLTRLRKNWKKTDVGEYIVTGGR